MGDIWGYPIYVKTHISHTISFNIPVSFGLTTLSHMLNSYKICLNTTNYLIFIMQDFIYWLWTSIVDCFGQLVSQLCTCVGVIYCHFISKQAQALPCVPTLSWWTKHIHTMTDNFRHKINGNVVTSDSQ